MIIDNRIKMRGQFIFIMSAVFLCINMLYAQEKPKSYQQEQLMKGFPPPIEKTVTKTNWLSPPFNRYAFQHISQVHYTQEIYRGLMPVLKLRSQVKDLDDVTYKNKEGKERTFRQMLDDTYTDAIVVLHKGKIVYEKYFNGQTPHQRHIMFSVTKSLVGTVAAVKVYQGIIDENLKVSDYVPELKKSAFGDATVRQVMDMTTGIQYSEKYDDINSEVVKHMVASAYRPIPEGYKGPETLYDFLPQLKKEGKHGEIFHYVSANTEVLAWIVKKATGKSVVEILQNEIWSKMGAERDGYILTDRAGAASWGGGFNGTARDMARFGLMMLNNGQINGIQCVPAEVVEGIRDGGSQKAFAQSEEGQKGEVMEGWSYRNQWWITHNEHKAYSAIGIYGQFIYVDPTAQVVIVKQSSFLSARNETIDYDPIVAFHELAKYLKEGK